jgi:Tfp pilus assembly protein PilX
VSTHSKGIAVIIALLTLLILSTLGASIMFSTQAEITTTYNFKRLTQARYIAEAGAQATENWLIYNYTVPSSFASFDMTQSPVQYNNAPVVLSALSGVAANYPDNTVQSAFNSALSNKPVSGLDVGVSYSTTATLQSMRLVTPFGSSTQVPLQSWSISSQATIGASQAQVAVTTTIEKFGSPVFSYAAFAVSATCGAITFGGGTSTDSFDSTQGSYAATKQNTSGNVGSNGNVNLNGGTTVVHGNGSTPFSLSGNCTNGSLTSLTANGGASVSGGMVTLSSTVSYAAPAAPSPAPPTTNQNTSGSCAGIGGCSSLGANSIAFAPGQYGNVSITGGATLHLSQGTYNINSISLAGNSTIVIDSGPVVLNVAGAGLNGNTAAVDLTGGTVSNTVSGKPGDFQILYAGSQPVNMSGGASSYGVVYTPNAPVTFAGGSDWFGSVIGNTVTDNGGTNIHYDRSLGSNLYIMGNYHATSFGWSKY